MKNLLKKVLFTSLLLSATMPFGVQANCLKQLINLQFSMKGSSSSLKGIVAMGVAAVTYSLLPEIITGKIKEALPVAVVVAAAHVAACAIAIGVADTVGR